MTDLIDARTARPNADSPQLSLPTWPKASANLFD